jgi:hypothetical protein
MDGCEGLLGKRAECAARHVDATGSWKLSIHAQPASSCSCVYLLTGVGVSLLGAERQGESAEEETNNIFLK